MEKVIFLDIDGVLNHKTSKEDIDLDCLYQLKRIVDSSAAKIVLTSSWKMYFLRGKNHPMRTYLEGKFHSLGLELYDIAPHIEGSKRALEINQWLKTHSEFKTFVIIDDNIFPGFQKMKKHLCITDWNMGGLTKERADKAIEILNQ